MEKSENLRRSFLKQAAAGVALAAVTPSVLKAEITKPVIIPSDAKGANDRIRVAVLGVNGRGQSHIAEIMGLSEKANVEVVTLCDPDMKVLQERAREFREKYGKSVKIDQDFRKAYEDKTIDAVTLASPNHWHALQTIWACQAGKHVYVEKPACHNVFEGRKMIEAARKYNVRVQTGFQNRSSRNVREAIQFLHDGGIGDVYMARGLCIKPRDSFGIAKDSEPPVTLHYDRWLGPASWRPYNEKKRPLQLALVLEHRKRRHGEPGSSPV